MSTVKIGFIGTGKVPEKPSIKGWGMAWRHAAGYEKLASCEIAACADIVPEHAEAFAAEFGCSAVYTDYNRMLKEEDLDVIDICTWPKFHAPMCIAAMQAGVPSVHCEKPMASTYAECLAIAGTAKETGCTLSFNHQRRFGTAYRKAKAIIDTGKIGRLQLMISSGNNMFDQGVNWIDILNFFNNEEHAEWVIGGINAEKVAISFGSPCESQAICHYKYKNGVHALCISGDDICEDLPAFRIIGSKGILELSWSTNNDPALRYFSGDGSGWISDDCEGESIHGPFQNHIDRAMAHVVDCFQNGRVPEMTWQNELNSMEIIFSYYESVKRRSRVGLPLAADSACLESMIEDGTLEPKETL
jgi:predicted dehydrogenase